MKTITLLMSLLLLPLVGYSQSGEMPDTDLICQTWVLTESEREGQHYKSSNSFTDDEYGIQFLSDGTMVVRQNAGWCGTPPITYANFPGTWEAVSETEILAEYEFWGGTIKCTYSITELGKNELRMMVKTEEVIRSGM